MEDEYITNAERVAKQTFLAEEVIEAGYDPEQFIAFAGKGEEVDIDTWSFEELQNIVREYIRAVKEGQFATVETEEEEQAPEQSPTHIQMEEPASPEEPTPSQQSQLQEHIVGRVIQTCLSDDIVDEALQVAGTQDTPDEVPEARSMTEDLSAPPQIIEESKGEQRAKSEAFEEVKIPQNRDQYRPVANRVVTALGQIDEKYSISGPTQPEGELTDAAEIWLSDPEVVKKGFFSSDYAVFFVMTKPNTWAVKRRFEDFVWLRNTLATLYGGHVVPTIPKEVNAGGFDTGFPKRKFYLQRFINNVISVPIFRTSPILLNFLKETDAKLWEKEKQKSKKVKKPDDPSMILTIEGKIPVNPDVPCAQFNARVAQFLSQYEAIQKKLKRSSGSLMSTLKTLSTEIMQYLALVTSAKDVNALIPEAELMQEVFVELQKILKDWSDFEFNRAKSINEYFNTFFKFQYKQVPGCNEVFKDREAHLKAFNTQENKLLAWKEKLWSKKQTGKWEVKPTEAMLKNKDLAFAAMLPKQTQRIEAMRDLYGYYNYQAYNETHRMLQSQADEYRAHFKNFADNQILQMGEMLEKWNVFGQRIYFKTTSQFMI